MLVSDDGDPTPSGQPPPAERLSPETVRALYDEHGGDLLAFLGGVLRNPDAAQDVCQATFQRLMEAGHAARKESIRGWLFKVAFHEAMAYRRKEARRETVYRHYGGDGLAPVDPDRALQSLVREEEVEALKRLLRQLPAEQQVVVRRRIHEGQTFAAIADELQLPLGTVLTRMRLALQKLQGWLGREQ